MTVDHEDESEDAESPADEQHIDEEAALKDMDALFEEWKQRISSNVDELLPSFEAMVASYKANAATDSAFSSAMRSFGKYHCGGATLSQSGGVAMIRSHRAIRVQPTATARRARQLLAGSRTRAALGRPPKNCLATKRSVEMKRQVLPPKKAPHKLSNCVARNQALGKTHSAK